MNFQNKIAEATKNMSDEERNSLMKMFETVSDDISTVTPSQAQPANSTTGCGDHPKYYSSIAAATTEVDEDGGAFGTYRETCKTERKLLEAGAFDHYIQSTRGNEDHKGKSWNAENRAES